MSYRFRVCFGGLLIATLFPALLTSSLRAVENRAERTFQAGAAMVDITPELGGMIVGGWQPIPAATVHDRLHVRCVVLDDGKTRLAFAICDNLGIARCVFDEAKRRIHKATGIEPRCQIMSATHTHSSVTGHFQNRYVPDQPLTEYQTRIIDAIVEGVELAVKNLRPAEVGWSTVDVPEHVFNRRWFMKPGTPTPNPFGGTDQVVFNPGRGNPNLDKPADVIDPEVALFSVRSVDGQPIALLANYSLHYIGGVEKGDLSADYFAVFAARVAELLEGDKSDPPMVGIMTNGTSGDINNINFGVKGESRERYEQMRIVAHDLADKVVKAEREMTYHAWAPLAAAEMELSLKTRRPTPDQLARAKKIAADPDGVELYHAREPIYADRLLKMQEIPKTREIMLTTFRIGDVGIATIPFEVFVDIGLELKRESPLATTFVISHAGGSTGYLPTPRHHRLGGYESWLGTNYVQKDASVKIVDAVLEMFEKIR